MSRRRMVIVDPFRDALPVAPLLPSSIIAEAAHLFHRFPHQKPQNVRLAMSAAKPQPGRKRPAPETAKDILGQVDTALGRIGRARSVAEAAGFANAAAALAQAERGVDATLEALEAALRDDLAAVLRARETNDE